MNEPKGTVAGVLQPVSGVVGAAADEQSAAASCGGACAESAETPMQYAVPMATGIGPVLDMTKAASDRAAMQYAVPLTQSAPKPAAMQYALPMTTGIGPIVDMTRLRVLEPGSNAVGAGAAGRAGLIDLTLPRVVQAPGESACPSVTSGKGPCADCPSRVDSRPGAAQAWKVTCLQSGCGSGEACARVLDETALQPGGPKQVGKIDWAPGAVVLEAKAPSSSAHQGLGPVPSPPPPPSPLPPVPLPAASPKTYAISKQYDTLDMRSNAQQAGQVIDTGGWREFKHVLAGGNGVIYAVDWDGRMYFYRYQGGTWLNAREEIGKGWDGYWQVFSGGAGVIYAVDLNGVLYSYEYLEDDREWAFGGERQQIGYDFTPYQVDLPPGVQQAFPPYLPQPGPVYLGGKFLKVFSAGGGTIFAIKTDGTLLYYKHLARGLPEWKDRGAAKEVDHGWDAYPQVFSTGRGRIYGIDNAGQMFLYQTSSGSVISKQYMSSGWNGLDPVFAEAWPPPPYPIQAYCIPQSVEPGGLIQFYASTTAQSYDVEFLRLRKRVINGVEKDASEVLPGSKHKVPGAYQPVMTGQVWQDGCNWKMSFLRVIDKDQSSGIYAAKFTDSDGYTFYVPFIVTPAKGKERRIAVIANTNTWNAYNDWGGRSQYTGPDFGGLPEDLDRRFPPGFNARVLSFHRPNPYAHPFPGDKGLSYADLLTFGCVKRNIPFEGPWVIGLVEGVGAAVGAGAESLAVSHQFREYVLNYLRSTLDPVLYAVLKDWVPSEHALLPDAYVQPASACPVAKIMLSLVSAELYLLGWLEDLAIATPGQPYRADVFSDWDFHRLGFNYFKDNYAAVILNVHPEYWSQQAREALRRLAYYSATKILYLGGNGVFEAVSFTEDGETIAAGADPEHLVFRLKKLPDGTPSHNRAFYANEGEILGVGSPYNYGEDGNFFIGGHYRLKIDPYTKDVGLGWMFESVPWGQLANTIPANPTTDPKGRFLTSQTSYPNDEQFERWTGQRGILGDAAGWEMDRNTVHGVPPKPPCTDVVVIAEADVEGSNPTEAGGGGAEMTYYGNASGGFVFSVGSITFTGSLVTDEVLQTVVRNVLKRALGYQALPGLTKWSPS